MPMLGNKSCYETGNLTAKQVAYILWSSTTTLLLVYGSLVRYFSTKGCTCLLHELEKCIKESQNP